MWFIVDKLEKLSTMKMSVKLKLNGNQKLLWAREGKMPQGSWNYKLPLILNFWHYLPTELISFISSMNHDFKRVALAFFK